MFSTVPHLPPTVDRSKSDFHELKQGLLSYSKILNSLTLLVTVKLRYEVLNNYIVNNYQG